MKKKILILIGLFMSVFMFSSEYKNPLRELNNYISAFRSSNVRFYFRQAGQVDAVGLECISDKSFSTDDCVSLMKDFYEYQRNHFRENGRAIPMYYYIQWMYQHTNEYKMNKNK